MSVRPTYPIDLEIKSPSVDTYILSYNQLEQLIELITNPTWFDTLKTLFNDLGQAIISITIFPRDVSTINESVVEEIKFLGKATGVTARKITNYTNIPNLNNSQYFGYFSFTFNALTNSYLDYNPYSSYSLYIPYFGVVNLDANDIVGKTIALNYLIDVEEGRLTYQLYRNENLNGELNQILIKEDSTDYGIKIPITMNNTAQQRMQSVLILMQSSLQFQNAKKPEQINNALANIPMEFLKNQPLVKTNEVKNTSALIGIYSCQKPYIIIERKMPITQNYENVIGKPLNTYISFSLLQGFTKVQEMHLENFNIATKNEIDMVERLLKEGVIF